VARVLKMASGLSCHAGFTAVTIFFISFARPVYTHIYIYIHTHICGLLETVYELQLLPNNTGPG
jgi:hypothetical protein